MAVGAGIRVVDGASVVLGAVALVVDGATVTAVVRTFEELAAGTTVATTIGADFVVGPSTELFDPDRPKMKAPTAAAPPALRRSGPRQPDRILHADPFAWPREPRQPRRGREPHPSGPPSSPSEPTYPTSPTVNRERHLPRLSV